MPPTAVRPCISLGHFTRGLVTLDAAVASGKRSMLEPPNTAARRGGAPV